MDDGGFLVRFIDSEGKAEEHRCYAVAFDYDNWTYKLNNDEPVRFPPTMKIEVIPEDGLELTEEEMEADIEEYLKNNPQG